MPGHRYAPGVAHVFRFFPSRGTAVASGATVALDPDDAKRLHRVLRLGPGEAIEVADGDGGVFAATVDDPKAGTVRIGDVLPAQPDLAPMTVLLAQSGPRADDAVEKLVELGVSAIGPLRASERRRDARLDRWERIAKGAAEQAKLARIPSIRESVDLADALVPGAILCSHEHPDCVIGDVPLTTPVTLLIGPEAGFTSDEHARAHAAGVPIASLGPTVLRTETAAIVAAALVRERLTSALR